MERWEKFYGPSKLGNDGVAIRCVETGTIFSSIGKVIKKHHTSYKEMHLALTTGKVVDGLHWERAQKKKVVL